MVLLCVENNILMDISGTKENGKFDSSENLDNDVRKVLTKYGCSKRWFTWLGFALKLFLRSESVVIFSALWSIDNKVKWTVVALNSHIHVLYAFCIP